MKQTLSHSEATRMIYGVYDQQFSYNAADELAEFYERLEDEMGEEIELDPVAIACDWSEYADKKDLLDVYGYLLNDDWEDEDDDEKVEAVLEYLRDNTYVIEFLGGYLVQAL